MTLIAVAQIVFFYSLCLSAFSALYFGSPQKLNENKNILIVDFHRLFPIRWQQTHKNMDFSFKFHKTRHSTQSFFLVTRYCVVCLIFVKVFEFFLRGWGINTLTFTLSFDNWLTSLTCLFWCRLMMNEWPQYAQLSNRQWIEVCFFFIFSSPILSHLSSFVQFWFYFKLNFIKNFSCLLLIAIKRYRFQLTLKKFCSHNRFFCCCLFTTN